MMDARRIAGWVTAPDGSRAVCPRCEGRAFIRLGEVRNLLMSLCSGSRDAHSLATHIEAQRHIETS